MTKKLNLRQIINNMNEVVAKEIEDPDEWEFESFGTAMCNGCWYATVNLYHKDNHDVERILLVHQYPEAYYRDPDAFFMENS